MSKIDYKKALKNLYTTSSREVVLVDVPPMKFLTLNGRGGPPGFSGEFRQAAEGLLSLSFAIRGMIKNGSPSIDYTVMPPEGLWRTGGRAWPNPGKTGDWKWTAMIMQPGFVTPDLFVEALDRVKEKKNPDSLLKARLDSFYEGLAAQIMHLGPHSAEGPGVEKLREFIVNNGFKPHGKHHLIFLNDPRRTEPEKIKTIIRQPISV